MTPTCKDCKYFGLTNPREGHCRIQPPVVLEKSRAARWPLVDNSDWCGSFTSDVVPASRGDTRPGVAALEVKENGIIIVTHHDGESVELSALEGLSEQDERALMRMVWAAV